MSGLNQQFAKLSYGVNPYRGFKSPPLRQFKSPSRVGIRIVALPEKIKRGNRLKNFILALALVSTSSAMANSFDNFVGDYAIFGKPTIKASGTAKECIRFGFQYLTGFTVSPDTNGYHQTYMLHFNFNGGSIGRGWMGHPIMDYDDKNEYGTGGSYAKTTGDATMARNEYTTWGVSSGVSESEPLVVSIQHN